MADPSAWNIPGTANSLADAIRRQAAAQAEKAQRKEMGKSKTGLTEINPQPNPLDQLMQQIQQINVEATPLETLMQQATGSAGAQYDPLIKELQGEMGRTKNRGQANQKEARAMYNALAQDIAGELPEITRQMSAASEETEDRYNAVQKELQNQYREQAQSQAELYKQLGIQAATPEASQQAMEDQVYFQNQSNSDEAGALQLLKEMKNADVGYNRETSQNTRLAGENTAQDIQAQLEDYLQTAGTKLSGLKASKESAIQAMLAQLQQQDAQRVNQAEENEYDRLMDMFNLQLKMQEMQNKAARDQADSSSKSLFSGKNGPSGAANYLSEVYGAGDTFSSKAIMDAINDVMADQSVIAGKFDTGQKDMSGNPIQGRTTDAYMIDLLRRRMMEGDLDGDKNPPLNATSFSQADINNAINALLAYQGKLK